MTIKYSGVTLGQIEAVLNKIGGEAAIPRLLADELIIVERKPPASRPEPVLDTIIHVDRSIRPVYPDWVEKPMHLELEAAGPAEYDLTNVEQWLHDGQEGGKWVKGERIYKYLKGNSMLESCLGLRDLEEIQKKGVAVFRKHFAGKAVFGWKSVVPNRHGNLGVPYLFESGGEVKLYWFWLAYDWRASNPALRFRK